MAAFPTGDNYTPSISSRKGQNTRVLVAEFGDGYNQRVADGINSISASFSNIWRGIPTVDGQVIIDFLEDKLGAESFTWTDPTTLDTISVTCTEWNRSPVSQQYETISAEFKRVFDFV